MRRGSIAPFALIGLAVFFAVPTAQVGAQTPRPTAADTIIGIPPTDCQNLVVGATPTTPAAGSCDRANGTSQIGHTNSSATPGPLGAGSVSAYTRFNGTSTAVTHLGANGTYYQFLTWTGTGFTDIVFKSAVHHRDLTGIANCDPTVAFNESCSQATVDAAPLADGAQVYSSEGTSIQGTALALVGAARIMFDGSPNDLGANGDFIQTPNASGPQLVTGAAVITDTVHVSDLGGDNAIYYYLFAQSNVDVGVVHPHSFGDLIISDPTIEFLNCDPGPPTTCTPVTGVSPIFVNAAPEPASIGLVATGLFGLAGFARRRRRSSSTLD